MTLVTLFPSKWLLLFYILILVSNQLHPTWQKLLLCFVPKEIFGSNIATRSCSYYYLANSPNLCSPSKHPSDFEEFGNLIPHWSFANNPSLYNGPSHKAKSSQAEPLHCSIRDVSSNCCRVFPSLLFVTAVMLYLLLPVSIGKCIRPKLMRLSNIVDGVIAELYPLGTLRLIRSIWKVIHQGCRQRPLRFHPFPLRQASQFSFGWTAPKHLCFISSQNITHEVNIPHLYSKFCLLSWFFGFGLSFFPLQNCAIKT